MKTALICGVSGQDGAFLARLLLQKGYTVIGTSRDARASSFSNLTRLGIRDQLTYESMSLGTLNILEAIRFLKLETRFFNASSSDYEQPRLFETHFILDKSYTCFLMI